VGRKVCRVWKCECRFVVRVFVICWGVRERRGAPATVPALFIRIVGGPSCGGERVCVLVELWVGVW
jgi:hypothetical protein